MRRGVFGQAIFRFSCGRHRRFKLLKYGGPAAATGEPLHRGRGQGRVVALSRVNAVFANDVGQLGQKFPEPGVLFDQRVSFVGLFVATKGGLIPAKGIL